MTPAEWLLRAARRTPEAPALYHGAQMVASYGQFAQQVAGLAADLRAQGLAPGDRIALFASNSPDYLIALLAIWHAGAMAVPINAKLHPAEAAWIISDSGARLCFTSDAALADHSDVPLRPLTDLSRTPFAQQIPPAALRPEDVIWLFYTSGTTGRPKGVQLSVLNLTIATLCYDSDVDPVQPQDAMLYAAPMSHGAGLYALVHLLHGARHVVPQSGGFDPAEIAQLAAEVGPLSLFAAPTMVRRMTDAARTGADFNGVKTVVYGGGPMYVADIIEAVDLIGPRFVQIYGQGEAPMAITALTRSEVSDRSSPEWRARLGSVGRAQGGVRLRIAGPDGQDLPPGQVGEILVQGALVMQGYWNAPEATAKTLRDGWLWTGDMGALDAEGYLTLHDRSKDVIISGGTNIYPREVEEALLEHPAVQEVSVIGQPDPEWGEIVVACVVCSAPLDDAALDAHCLDRIARFKRPKRYEHLTALPKNSYGKVLKTELRARLSDN